jgi:hypothetical protein
LRSSSVLRLISSCCLHVAQEPAIIAHFLHSAIAERRNDEATAAKSRGTARDTIPVHERSPHAERREGFGSIRNGSCHIQRESAGIPSSRGSKWAELNRSRSRAKTIEMRAGSAIPKSQILLTFQLRLRSCQRFIVSNVFAGH